MLSEILGQLKDIRDISFEYEKPEIALSESMQPQLNTWNEY